ncbi:hypothetical protein MHBO_000543 [Bonamia ostreae]|uniref:Uncharacterized protein n=1 Tax=Bonamia ostreae TaxID=126728 RepID=A0ABV2AFZ8_9EUKA
MLKIKRSLTRTNTQIVTRSAFCAFRQKRFEHVEKTHLIKEEEELDKIAPKFYYKEELDTIKKINKAKFSDLKQHSLQISKMRLDELKEIPKELPYRDEFKKHGLDLPANLLEEDDKKRDYIRCAKAIKCAIENFSDDKIVRVYAYICQDIRRVEVPAEIPGMEKFESKFDSDRVTFARTRIEYALKFNEKPYFIGDYMKRLGEKVARRYYADKLDKLGYK